MGNRKLRSIGVCIVLIVIMLFLVGNNCPLEHIIGIPCPGCNLFTALYHLIFKFDLSAANYYHPVVIPFLLYCLGVFFLLLRNGEAFTKTKSFRWLSIIFIALLLAIYAVRMMTIYPEAPMQYNSDAILNKIFHLH